MSWRRCEGNHDWQPLEGWCGRYKCAACFVVGYHKVVVDARIGRAGLSGPQHAQIIPYLCKACGSATTAKDKPCPDCREGKLTRNVWRAVAGGKTLYGPDKTRLARVMYVRSSQSWAVSAKGRTASLPDKSAIVAWLDELGIYAMEP